MFNYKQIYYKLWSEVLNLVNNKEHLKMVELNKIIALKSHSKKRIIFIITKIYPKFIPIDCPLYLPYLSNFTFHWIAVFINADFLYLIYIIKFEFNSFQLKILFTFFLVLSKINLFVIKKKRLFYKNKEGCKSNSSLCKFSTLNSETKNLVIWGKNLGLEQKVVLLKF